MVQPAADGRLFLFTLACAGSLNTVFLLPFLAAQWPGYEHVGQALRFCLSFLAKIKAVPARTCATREVGLNVVLSLASAEAQERPLTATSVAGHSRRAYRRAYRTATYPGAAGYGSGLSSGYGCPAYSSYWVPYGTSWSAPYGISASSYAQACERLKSGYAAPYGHARRMHFRSGTDSALPR